MQAGRQGQPLFAAAPAGSAVAGGAPGAAAWATWRRVAVDLHAAAALNPSQGRGWSVPGACKARLRGRRGPDRQHWLGRSSLCRLLLCTLGTLRPPAHGDRSRWQAEAHKQERPNVLQAGNCVVCAHATQAGSTQVCEAVVGTLPSQDREFPARAPRIALATCLGQRAGGAASSGRAFGQQTGFARLQSAAACTSTFQKDLPASSSRWLHLSVLGERLAGRSPGREPPRERHPRIGSTRRHGRCVMIGGMRGVRCGSRGRNCRGLAPAGGAKGAGAAGQPRLPAGATAGCWVRREEIFGGG